jgi:hypothetical protein
MLAPCLSYYTKETITINPTNLKYEYIALSASFKKSSDNDHKWRWRLGLDGTEGEKSHILV